MMTIDSLPRWLTRILQIFMAVMVPVLLIVGSVRLVMLPFYLQLEYTRPGFPEDYYGFSTEDRLQYGPLGIEYMLNGADIDFLGDLRLPRELCWNPPLNAEDCPMFNPLELQHMVDVKVVAQTVFAVTVVLALIMIAWIIVLWRSHRGRCLIRAAMMQGSILTLALVATIVVIAVAAWDTFFNLFHALFFEAGTWRFYYSDTLIRLYPEQFWFDTSLVIGTITTISALVILAVSWKYATKCVDT